MGNLVYNLLLWTACAVGAPLWLALALGREKWRAGLAERLGLVASRIRPQAGGGAVVWIHAVSVGEVLAAAGLVRQLERECQVYVSTTTRTGQELARKRFGAERVFYFPIDLQFAIAPYLRRLRPSLVVLLETEFWPNFLRSASRRARVAVVNARISDDSLPGYMRFRRFIGGVLAKIDIFVAQSSEDERRLIAIGVARERVTVGGNLKFDWQPPPEAALVEQLRRAIEQAGIGLVVVAGSTVEGEEPLVMAAFRELRTSFPESLLVLAPRHPERFVGMAASLKDAGVRIARRSEWREESLKGTEIFLLDTIGELASLYQMADIAFVGGSLAPRGGHNILEPAYFGKAIVVGPFMDNFRDIARAFAEAGALIVCNSTELGGCWTGLANDASRRRELGARARGVMQENTGATERTIGALRRLPRSGR